MKFVYVHGFPTQAQIDEVWSGPFAGCSIHVHHEYLEGGYDITLLTTLGVSNVASQSDMSRYRDLSEFFGLLVAEEIPNVDYMGAEDAKLSEHPLYTRRFGLTDIEWYGSLWGYERLESTQGLTNQDKIEVTPSGYMLVTTRRYQE